MTDTNRLPLSLMKAGSFSRKDFSAALKDAYDLKDHQVTYELKKRLEKGSVLRTGWGQFTLPSDKTLYRHSYSEAALQVVEAISSHYTDLDFQIFELTQLNGFMNHLAAHNTIIVSVENDLLEYVFGTLWDCFPGRVLLKPNEDEYYRYLLDDEIVVNRLPSESPKGYGPAWQSRLEKILVDITVDKFVSRIVPESEKKTILDNAFHDYLIDRNTILRYAKRKGAEKKIRSVLQSYERTT